MREAATVVVPYDAARLRHDRRLGDGEVGRRTRQVREALLLAWTQAGRPRIRGAARVTTILRRERPSPGDAASGGTSAARELLLALAGAPSAKVEVAPVRQETGAAWALEPEVVFLIEPLEAGA
jgi:hypothetical protein